MKPPKATQSAGLLGETDPKFNRELSSIKSHLSLDMERQIQSLHHELLQELEDLVRKHDKNTPHQANTLGSLIHTITDSKLHKLNLELRQHMTAKLDALLQDMKDEQKAFQARLMREMEHRLEQPEVASRNSMQNLLGTASSEIGSSNWANLPVLLVLLAVLLMLVSWPS